MPKFTARVQYPWTVWYEQTVEVEAATEAEARALAIKAADDKGWDGECRMSDGEAGATEIWTIEPAGSDEAAGEADHV